MAEEQENENENEDSRFYFVKPSVPGADLDAYPGSRVFHLPSWEWLLERYLRRVHVLSAVGKPAAEAYLSERRGVYRLRRLLSAGVVGPDASAEGGIPVPPPVPLPTGGRHAVEPEEGEGEDEGEGETQYEPDYGLAGVGYAPRDLASLVPALALSPPSCGWAVPGPVSDAVSEVSLDASATETLRASFASSPGEGSQADEFSLSDSIEPGDALPLSRHPFFRMLGDFRLDDEPDVAQVPAWDSQAGEWASRRVHVPSAVRAVRADDSEHGEFRILLGSGRGAGKALVFQGGISSVTSETALPCALNLDVSAFETDRDVGLAPNGGSYHSQFHPPFKRGGKAELEDVVGVALSLPAPSRGGVGVVSSVGLGRPYVEGEADETPDPLPVMHLRIARSPDWNGAATWWGGPGGFPHEDPAPVSAKEREQVAELAKAQPCVPPAFAGGLSSIPAEDEEDGAALRTRLFEGGAARDFGSPLPAICPAEASRHLDALTTTVRRVDRVFAFVSAREDVAGDETYRNEPYGDTGGTPSSASGTYRKAVVRSGSYCGEFSGLLSLVPRPGSVSASYRYKTGQSGGGRPSGGSVVYMGLSKSRTVSCRASGLVCLASAAPAGMSVLTTERWSETRSPGSSSSGGTSGDAEPEGEEVRDPPPESALLLPPAVLQWVASASLYAVFDAVSVPSGRRSRTDVAPGDGTVSQGATGRRTARRRVSVVKVGDLDPATGAVPPLDVVALRKDVVDPLPDVPPSDLFSTDTVLRNEPRETFGMSGGNQWDYGTTPMTNHASSKVVPPETADPSVTLLGLYLVVEWDFDTESPPSVPPGSAGLSLSAAGVRLRFDAAAAAVGRADAAANAAATAAAGASSALDGLDAVLGDDPGARSGALAALRQSVADAEDALADAEDALADAEDALADAEDALARGDDGAEGAFSAACAARDGALRDLNDAEAALAEAEAALAEAEAAVSKTVEEAEAAIADARADVSALESSAAGLASAVEAAKALKSTAQAAVGAMESSLSSATLDAAEAAVSALEAAVPGLESAAEGLLGDESDAEAAVKAARSAVWAAV